MWQIDAVARDVKAEALSGNLCRTYAGTFTHALP